MIKKNSELKDIKTRTILFLYSIFIIVAFIAIDKIFFFNSINNLIVKNGKDQIDEREKLLQKFIDRSELVLKNLRTTEVFTKYLQEPNEKNLKHLKKMFLLTSNIHSSFMQLRYIDKDGNEIVRVDKQSENSKSFLSTNLQNKSNRYYFINSKNNPTSGVWFSNLDLNIENGQIEKPYKPTLRAVLPIVYEDGFDGILIINFFMDEFLKAFEDITLYNMILVDKDGNTLIHHDEKRSWGLFLQKPYNLSQEYENYKEVLTNKNYTSGTLISRKLDVPIANEPILILKPKEEYLDSLNKSQNLQYIFTSLLVLSLTYLLSFFILKIIKNLYKNLNNTKRLNKKLNILNEKFTTILETTNDMVMILDKNRVIEFSNKATFDISGFEENELINKKLDRFLKVGREEFISNFENSLKNSTQRFEFILPIKNKSLILFVNLIKIKKQNKVLLIAKDITEIKQQQDLVIQQSKLASMGEMLSNIAHQWRQPLNILNLVSTDLKYKFAYGQLDQERVDEISSKLQNQIEYLSKTIDDFRDFFTPTKNKELFKIHSAIKSTINIVGSALKDNLIELKLDIDDSLELNSYKSQLEQVLINILNNAKDAIVQSKTENPFIEIKVYKAKKIMIEIKNNGGAIKEDILEKIFEPYFSTKFNSKGTGLGLYMSKMIIEKNMGGSLNVQCQDDTTSFIISFES